MATQYPAKRRQPKAPTLRLADWEPHKDRIHHMYIVEDRSLESVRVEIREESEDQGFAPTLRQYKSYVEKMGWQKNVKKRDMEVVIRERQKSATSGFQAPSPVLNGRKIESRKIKRWTKRNTIPDGIIHSESRSSPQHFTRHMLAPTPKPQIVSVGSSTPYVRFVGSNSQYSLPEELAVAATESSVIQHRVGRIANTPSRRRVSHFTSYDDLIDYLEAQDTSPAAYLWLQDAIPQSILRFGLRATMYLKGYDESSTIKTLFKISNLYHDQMRYKVAVQIGRYLVDAVQARNPARPAELLNAATRLVSIRATLGDDYSEAKHLLIRSLATQLPVNDSIRKAYTRAQLCLTRLHCTMYNYVEAESILASLHAPNTVTTSDIPQVLYVKGSLLLNQNRPAEAVPFFEEALRLDELAGGSSRNHLFRQIEQGTAYMRCGRLLDAQRTFEVSLARGASLLGEWNIATVVSRLWLAKVSIRRGNALEAEGMLLPLITHLKDLKDMSHRDLIGAQFFLADSYILQNRCNDAELLLREILGTCQKESGPEGDGTLRCVYWLAEHLSEGPQERWEEARQLMQACVDGSRRSFGEQNPRTMKRIALLQAIEDNTRAADSRDVYEVDPECGISEENRREEREEEWGESEGGANESEREWREVEDEGPTGEPLQR